MKFDLLIKNIKIVDVINKKATYGYVTISNGIFILTEEGDPSPKIEKNSKEIVDGNKSYAIPGLIDTHMHIESTFVTPKIFAELTVPHGLSTILWDFHEIANVGGIEGFENIYKNTKTLPLNIYIAAPSCVPATDKDIETPNFTFTDKEISHLLSKKEVIALGEVMDYKGLISKNKRLLNILKKAREYDIIIDGHVPTLSGMELSTYLSFGITSDHTLADPKKIEEELRKGVWVQIQDKSLTKENISYLKERRSLEHILFVTDDVPPDKILDGHLLFIINKAISMGLSPYEVLASATIRAAKRIRKCNIGAISPGREANFFLSKDIDDIKPYLVYFKGALAAEEGRFVYKDKIKTQKSSNIYKSYIFIEKITEDDLKFSIKDGSYRVNAVSFNDKNSLTHLEEVTLKFENRSPILKDEVSMIFVESRNGSHKTMGFIKNLGPKRGALATTYSHDSHPLTVLGKNTKDMVIAANKVVKEGGGIAVAIDDKIIFFLPLPVYGLLSNTNGEEIVRNFQKLKEIFINIGIRHKNPTQIITLLTLSVSPFYKISDKGLVDTEKRKLISVIKGGST